MPYIARPVITIDTAVTFNEMLFSCHVTFIRGLPAITNRTLPMLRSINISYKLCYGTTPQVETFCTIRIPH